MGTIVVGVDGSEGSRHALEFALSEAELRGATLRVVRAWSLWSAGVTGTAEADPWPGGHGEALDEAHRKANGQLTEWVASAQRRTAAGAVATELETLEGDAGPVLLAASRDADLVVIGTRGKHDPGRWLLTSVSRALTRDATCPVVIVPGERRPGDVEA